MDDLAQISAGTRHLLPDQQRARSQQPVVSRPKHVTAHAEEIQHEAVGREKSLRVRGGFEPTYLTLALPPGLMRDLRSIVRVLARVMDDIGHHLTMGSPIASRAAKTGQARSGAFFHSVDSGSGRNAETSMTFPS